MADAKSTDIKGEGRKRAERERRERLERDREREEARGEKVGKRDRERASG